jgi:hypothetical protein
MICRKLVPALVLLLTTAAFAANKASCTVAQAVTVGGHQIAPGEYQFQWDGSGPSVSLNILSKGKLVTTVPARVVDENGTAERTTMRMRENDDGIATLKQIHFADKKYALVFGDETASAESSASGNGKAAVSKP